MGKRSRYPTATPTELASKFRLHTSMTLKHATHCINRWRHCTVQGWLLARYVWTRRGSWTLTRKAPSPRATAGCGSTMSVRPRREARDSDGDGPFILILGATGHPSSAVRACTDDDATSPEACDRHRELIAPGHITRGVQWAARPKACRLTIS